MARRAAKENRANGLPVDRTVLKNGGGESSDCHAIAPLQITRITCVARDALAVRLSARAARHDIRPNERGGAYRLYETAGGVDQRHRVQDEVLEQDGVRVRPGLHSTSTMQSPAGTLPYRAVAGALCLQYCRTPQSLTPHGSGGAARHVRASSTIIVGKYS